jgi:uncharacterized OB-fold protein
MMGIAISGKEAALKALAKRRAHQPKQIDNASLYAGSPMYFYCRSCGHLSDTKPEGYLSPPRRLCEDCQDLKDRGWLE